MTNDDCPHRFEAQTGGHPADCPRCAEEVDFEGIIDRWPPGGGPPALQDRKFFTCEGCIELERNCPFAWDLYNLDGECLAAK